MTQNNQINILNNDPPIFEIENFFSEELCDTLQRRAEAIGLKHNSQTFSSFSGAKRTSTTWYMNYKDFPELVYKTNLLTGIDVKCFEEPQVVRYELGDQFSWHYDALPSTLLKGEDNSGQRLITVIVYLNTVDMGDATCFKDLNLQVRPKKGKALVFFPCYFDGRCDERTMHAGQVAMDTKWIAQMWIRQRHYQPTIPPGNNHDDGILAIVNSGLSN